MTTSLQLGNTVTGSDVRQAMAAALTALTAVGRSRADVLGSMQSTLRSIHEELTSTVGSARSDEATTGARSRRPNSTGT